VVAVQLANRNRFFKCNNFDSERFGRDTWKLSYFNAEISLALRSVLLLFLTGKLIAPG
jgi:hypothetical protein